MPVGVGPFPKTIDAAADKYLVCDRGSATGCVDVTNYDKKQRNLLQHTLLSIATDQCHQFKTDLYGWSRVGIFSGGVSHLLSAVSAVLPHKGPSTTPSAITPCAPSPTASTKQAVLSRTLQSVPPTRLPTIRPERRPSARALGRSVEAAHQRRISRSDLYAWRAKCPSRQTGVFRDRPAMRGKTRFPARKRPDKPAIIYMR